MELHEWLCFIGCIRDTISLDQISSLDIIENRIPPLVFDECDSLEELNISGRISKKTLDSIFALPNIKILRFTNCGTSFNGIQIPTESRVQLLEIYDDFLEKISLDIIGVASLKTLSIECPNTKKILPFSSKKLSINTLHLNLHSNCEFNFSWSSFPHLEKLTLGNIFHISKKLESITKLENFYSLSLYVNMGISEEELAISSRILTYILPLSLKLRALGLSYEEPQTVPLWLGKLVNLESLYLMNISNDTFPQVIKKMKKIKCLTFDGAAFNSIPDWVYELGCLEELRVFGSPLSESGIQLEKLEKLHRLEVIGNGFTLNKYKGMKPF